MNQITPPPKIEIIPSSAPFSEAQRSWLNGFFAGLLSDAPTPLSAEQGAAVMQGAAGDGDDGEAPWHDQTMPIADRMKLAEGRPLRRRMMAAMAQQDCGQCGYNCNDYSDAIAGKSEARLNLCVPGGKETARMLKSLYEEIDKAPAAPSSAPAAAPLRRPRSSAEPGRSRDNPVAGEIRLAPPAEQGADRKRKPGTSISICPAAASIMSSAIPSAFSPATISGCVDQIIALLGASHTTKVSGKTLREVLLDDVSLAPAPDTLFELISYHHRRRAAREGAGAGAGRGSRRRCRDARRDGGAAKILRRAAASRKPSSRRWSRCSRGSIRSPRRTMRRRENCR